MPNLSSWSDPKNWSPDTKVLQLALCFTDDALACLLLLGVKDRQNYIVLVGALQQQFGNFMGADILCTEMNNRHRYPSVSLTS